MNKKEIEAIYPLTFTQNGLLLHHLEASSDQGIIQVEFELKGKLDFEIFQKSWESTIARHGSLRSSVHYQKIKTPVRIVHKTIEFEISRHDLTKTPKGEQALQLKQFKTQDRINGLNLSTTPIFRVNLFQLSEKSNVVLWTCHHINLDGWSGMNICKDLLQFYEYFAEGNQDTPIEFEYLPKYKAYLDWLKKQDSNTVQIFWKKYFEGFTTPTLFSTSTNKLPAKYKSISFKTNEVSYNKIKAFLLKHKLTENSFIQGVWALLLCKYFKQNDVCFGTISSGRFAEIPNMELMADMFTNLVPVRVNINQNLSFFQFLKDLQSRQFQTQDFNFAHINEIASWAGLENHKAIFDSLLIVENFPKNKTEYKHLRISNYKSNVTSSMPISLAVKSSDHFEFLLKYNSSLIPSEFAKNIIKGLEKLISQIVEEVDTSLSFLLNNIGDYDFNGLLQNSTTSNSKSRKLSRRENYKTETEEIILDIWKNLFNHKHIALYDDFFELGGTSFQAIKLSSFIKEKLGFNFKPTTLIKRRTIKSIALLIDNSDREENETWGSIVTLNESGDKTPLFCTHTTGGHTLIFKVFASHFIDQRPVYGLQPKGLDGVSALHDSIEELAEDYIKEMKTVQPNGPYYLLAYCFIPSAIVNEIAFILNSRGEIAHIIAVDSNFYYNRRKRNIGKLIAVLKLDKTRIKSLRKEINLKLNQWKSVYSKKNILIQNTADEHIEVIKQVDQNITVFFRKYKAKPINGYVLCIISASFIKHHNYEINPRTWKKIAKLGFKKIIFECEHGNMFTEPHVKHLAKIIDDYMEQIKMVNN